jgi:alpha-beta hydrolase superfamily lysophospholipase
LTSASIDQILELERSFVVHKIRDDQDVLDLRYGVYFRGPGTPKKYVFFSNGRSEWLEKYAYLALDLELDQDTALVMWDHRGQGASGGTPAWIDDYETYARDTARIVEATAQGKPYMFMAHSMGGLIALYSTLTGKISPRAMVLGSPLLGLPNSPVPRPLARPLSRLLTQVGLGAVSSGAGSFTKRPFENNDLTQSRVLYERIQRSPLKIPGATFEWVSATFKAIDVIFDAKNLAKLACPTLILGGSAETVVDQAAFGNWVKKAQELVPTPVQLTMIPSARHELFSEAPQMYQAAVREAVSWLRAYL